MTKAKTIGAASVRSTTVRPRRTASRSQVVLVAGYAARLATGLLVTALLGRYLGPDDFGFFTLIGTVFFATSIVFDAGTGAVVVREIARDPKRERDLLEALKGWRRAAGILLGLAVLAWAILQPDVERRWVLVFVALSLPLLDSGALMAAFRMRQEVAGPEAIRVGSQLAFLLAVAAFVHLALPGALVGLLLVLRTLCDANAVGWLASRRLGYRPRGRLHGRTMMSLLSLSAFQGASVLAQTAYVHLDIFLVLLLRGQAELGAYSAAFRPINTLLALPPLLMLPLLPIFSSLARTEEGRLLVPYVRRTTTILVGIGGLAGVAGAMLAPDLVQLLYSGRYTSGPLDAAASFSWLSVAFGLVFSSAVFATALLALGRERRLFQFAALGLLVNLTSNLILIPRWGFVAAAVITAVTYGIVAAATLVELVRLLGPRVLSAAHLLALLPAAALGLAIQLAPDVPVLRVAAGVAMGTLGSALFLALPSSRRLRRELSAAGWMEGEAAMPVGAGRRPAS